MHGGNLVWAAQIAGCPASAILDFSASINPLGLPTSAVRAIQAGIPDLVAYPDPTYAQLRRALGAWHDISPDWILPGNGAAELLTWAGWELAQQEITYLLTPAFGDYRRALGAFKAQVRECLLGTSPDKFCPPIEGLSLPAVGAKTGLLLNNPHNPTGKLFTIKEILPYLEQFNLVVVDEAFMDFVPLSQQQSLIPFVAQYPNLVIVRSLTKFYSLPGLRLGYAISHPSRLQKWQELRDPWAVNSLAAQVAEAVIHDQKWEQQTRNWLLPAREQLYQGLQKIKGLHPLASHANFLLVGTSKTSSQLQYQLLEEQQILIRDCLSFPELGENYFRVAVRTQTDNQHLLQALASIF